MFVDKLSIFDDEYLKLMIILIKIPFIIFYQKIEQKIVVAQSFYHQENELRLGVGVCPDNE